MRLRLISFVAALTLVIGLSATLAPSFNADAAADDGKYDAALLTSAARTATGTSDAACGFGKFTKLAVQQVVSAASGTTPTLDTVLQHSIDGGTTWFTLVTMTQRTAAANELKVYTDVEGTTGQMIGDCLRVSYTIGGTTPSFTFTVAVQAQ